MFGISYSNVPVKSGLGWEIEATYGQFNYQRDKFASIPSNNFSQLEEQFLTDLALDFLDVSFQIKYMLGGFMSVGVGAGPSMLLFGEADMQKIFTAEGNIPLLDETSNTTFGFLDEESSLPNTQAPFPEGESDIASNIFGDVNLGMPGKGFALGARYNYRMHSKLFDRKNAGQPFYQFYLQVRL